VKGSTAAIIVALVFLIAFGLMAKVLSGR